MTAIARPTWTPPQQGQWTYDDYARLPDNGLRYEVIRGRIYMSPSPRTRHQSAIVKILVAIDDAINAGAGGKVILSPFDVIMGELATPVQPDLVYVRQANLAIIKELFAEGVPDLLVEVLSPGNVGHDRRLKFQVYLEAGVPEYWIVDSETGHVEVYVRREDVFVQLGDFTVNAMVRSEVLPNLQLKAADVFAL